MRTSKAGQETAVGQGLAVGCLALGVVAIAASKFDVERAFERAWREWPSAGLFPVVRASLERNDLPRILRDSAGRRGGGIAWWNCGREWVPVLGEGFDDAREAGDALETGTDVLLGDWRVLARDLVSALGEDLVRRDALVAVELDDDDADDDDHDPRDPGDDSGYGPGSYYAHASGKDD